MILTLERFAFRPTYTIGRLYANGIYVCDVIEDKDRGLSDSMGTDEIRSRKVYGETAIPYGTYKVSMTYSPRFKRKLPLVEGVKGFDGIRIHSGNTARDSLGCIIVGYNTEVGIVTSSRKALAKVIGLIEDEECFLIIKKKK